MQDEATVTSPMEDVLKSGRWRAFGREYALFGFGSHGAPLIWRYVVLNAYLCQACDRLHVGNYIDALDCYNHQKENFLLHLQKHIKSAGPKDESREHGFDVSTFFAFDTSMSSFIGASAFVCTLVVHHQPSISTSWELALTSLAKPVLRTWHATIRFHRGADFPMSSPAR